MTKREFIKKLHLACPQCREDLEAFQKMISSLESGSSLDDLRARVEEALKEIDKKWPRARDFITWPTFQDFTADWNSSLNPVSTLKALFSSLLARPDAPDQFEFDPWRMSKKNIAAVIEHLASTEEGAFPIDQLMPEENPDPMLQDTKSDLRRSAGEQLFSKAAFVIPIYPETNRDDIDWGYVEQLKAEIYGRSYRPKHDKHEKIIKIFERGQLREQKKEWKTWKAIANSVNLSLTDTQAIYTRAHEVVYGHRPEKRDQSRGPSLREMITKTGEIEKFFSYLDPETDECFKCHRFGDEARGRRLTRQHYAALSKYLSLPPYPHDDAFICGDCLSQVSLPRTDATD